MYYGERQQNCKILYTDIDVIRKMMCSNKITKQNQFICDDIKKKLNRV